MKPQPIQVAMSSYAVYKHPFTEVDEIMNLSLHELRLNFLIYFMDTSIEGLDPQIMRLKFEPGNPISSSSKNFYAAIKTFKERGVLEKIDGRISLYRINKDFIDKGPDALDHCTGEPTPITFEIPEEYDE